MLMNKISNFWAERKHNHQRNNYCCDHDLHMFRGAACRNNTVKRKNHIYEYYLKSSLCKAEYFYGSLLHVHIFTFQFLMNFVNGFINKKHTTGKHYQACEIKSFFEYDKKGFTFLG